ncbi:minor capsid protein [Cohnella nanjingensis]|uniref:Minor capsid protein n=1 Tax=Cohnella nanjingensis TaxID=1387779 RepID=A0A7X0VEG9_9BACL|nr:minor capsid protein [Cohnella nanjingensis]MBB6670268.1 minor capsid protein [Cohnella nanjingensis]
MKPTAYWQKRSEQIAARQFAKAEQYEAAQDREYARAVNEIRRSVEVFYQRYAINDSVSMAEARKQLSGRELGEFKMSLEEFTAKAKDNADGRWTQGLNNVYFRTRVSRYEALQLQIRQQAEMVAGSRQRGTSDLLGDVYTDTYHRTLYEIQKGTGMGVSFARIDPASLEMILRTDFAGSNWSKRIWGDRDKLATELRTKLAQAFIRGEPAERTIRDLAARMDVSRSNAERLVQTEAAFFVGQATAAGYRESGVVNRYEILATLDNRTSSICRGMDGKVFLVSEQEPGVNYPPFHARCRTTTVPYFDDEIDPGERIAKDTEGDTYHVPADMKYEQWYDEYVRPDKALADVYRSFAAAEPAITKHIKEVSAAAGAEPVGLDFRLKTLDSFKRKVSSDYAEQKAAGQNILRKEIASGMNDVVRYTAVADGDRLVQVYEDMKDQLLSKGYTFIKAKNSWNQPFNPYKGVNVVFHAPNGPNFELQFHTPESFDMKQNRIHLLYEEYRLGTTKPARKKELLQQMLEMSKGLKKPKGIEQIR